LSAEDDSFDSARFLNQNEFIVSGGRNVERHRIDKEQLILTHRIPKSWLQGDVRDIIPLRNGGFSILTNSLKLQSYTGDPDVVEPISFQFNGNNLEYQYSYTRSNGLVYLRFLNKTYSRLEDYDCALAEQIYSTTSIDSSALHVRGSQNNFLAITNEAVMVYTNNTFTSRCYYFNDGTGVFLAPAANQRNNEKFFAFSDRFDPVRHLRIRQNSSERDFTAQDAASTIGG